MSYSRYRGGDLTTPTAPTPLTESSISFGPIGDDGEPSHIYYNMTLRNQDTGGTRVKRPATFQDYRISPIVNNPSKYYLSVIRWYAPTSTIPIQVVPIAPFPNTNPNLTTYSVTLSYNGADYVQNVIWEPVDLSATVPNPLSASSPLQDVSTSYYYLYSYYHLLNLINKSLAAALAALVAANAPLVGLVAAPLLNYNPASSLFSISAQKTYYDLNTDTPISIYINNNLQSLLLCFDYRYFGNGAVNGKAWEFNMIVDGVNDVDNPLIVLQQEVSSLAAWSSLASLVFISNSIPVIAESMPPSVAFGADTVSGATAPSTASILTDFLASGADTRVSLQYAANGVYRMLDLQSDRPMMSADVSIMWQDIYGNMYPLLLDSNTAATIKILFRKKSLGI